MGHRLELYCDQTAAAQVIAIANKYNVDAQIVGKVLANEAPDRNRVTIIHEGQEYSY